MGVFSGGTSKQQKSDAGRQEFQSLFGHTNRNMPESRPQQQFEMKPLEPIQPMTSQSTKPFKTLLGQ